MTLSLEILDRLIAFETVSDRSNISLITYVEDFLRSRGFRLQRIADPNENKAGILLIHVIFKHFKGIYGNFLFFSC